MKVETGVSFAHHDTRPSEVRKVAASRMTGFVKEFGRTILLGSPMILQAFAESCYLQGCEDMAIATAREGQANDYQI